VEERRERRERGEERERREESERQKRREKRKFGFVSRSTLVPCALRMETKPPTLRVPHLLADYINDTDPSSYFTHIHTHKHHITHPHCTHTTLPHKL